MWRFRWASLPKVAPHWVHLFSILPVVEHTTVVPSCGIGDGGGWLLGWGEGDTAGVVVVTAAAAAIVADVAADVVVVDDDVPGVLVMVVVVDDGGAVLALALVSLVGVVMVVFVAHQVRQEGLTLYHQIGSTLKR